MTAWLESAARVEAPAPARAPRPARQPVASPGAEQRRVAGGVVWIAMVATLLAGVVALNVAVLRLNVRLDELTRERANLHAENAQLASRLSSASAPPRIESLARVRLGLVPANPEQITYLDLAGASK